MIPLHYKFRQSTSDPGTWYDGQKTDGLLINWITHQYEPIEVIDESWEN